MDATVPSGRCPAHPDMTAAAACTRCGVFVCVSCRRFYDYQPLCAQCYERRSHAQPASSRARWSVGLALIGLATMVIPLGIPAVVLAHMELSAIENGEAPAGGLGYARAAALIGWLANSMFLLVVVGAGLALYFMLDTL